MIINAFINTKTIKDKRGKINHGCGFGDYIRGSLALYQIAKELNIEFKMDLSNHAIGKYLIGHGNSTSIVPTELFRNYDIVWKDNMKKYMSMYFLRLRRNPTRKYEFVTLCNTFPSWPLDEDCKAYVRDQMLPTPELEKIISQHKPKKDYVSVHIRTGDWVGFSQNDNAIQELAEKISDNMKEIKSQAEGKKIFVFSDSMALKELLKQQHKTEYTQTTPSHSMMPDCNIQDMLVDWFMLQYSNHVYQFTNNYHGWGSGFSDSANWLRDVPITKFKF